MTDDVSASLVRFALSDLPAPSGTSEPPQPSDQADPSASSAPDGLRAAARSAVRSAVSGPPDAAHGSVRDGHLAALGSAYPPGDLRVQALNTAAALAGSGTHPLIAATAAVAAVRNEQRAAEATVLACEVACRLAVSLGVRPETLAVVAAALAGSTEPHGALHALGLAATQTTTVTGDEAGDGAGAGTGNEGGAGNGAANGTDDGTADRGRGADGAEVRALRAAFAAADGMEAALFGERGFTAPAQPLEGRRGLLALLAPEAEAPELVRELGTRWSAEQIADAANGAALR